MPTAVMQVVDSLELGGTERIAVNLANCTPRDRYQPHLCATRRSGPMAAFLQPGVPLNCLERRWRFDASALRSGWRLITRHQVHLLHAHSSSIFFARALAAAPPHPAVVWHDHYGRCEFDDRPAWLYRVATRGIGGVITVNERLANWAREHLRIPPSCVWQLPNLVETTGAGVPPPALPGQPGKRIVCVANFRAQKDHDTLLEAMAILSRGDAEAHLLLVGQAVDVEYRDHILRRIGALGLAHRITCLGARTDVEAILAGCDVGVLASRSEGLPVVLLEYGRAGLPVVVTEVGQCADVLDGGRAGVLVPPGNPRALSDAIAEFLASPARRNDFGCTLQRRVLQHYSAEAVSRELCRIYDAVLERGPVER